jgi:succinate dehydrogenase/fumarate reductase flavoprotein subunit
VTNSLHCDVLVAGSGAGGFAAALAARLAGLDVVMVEKEPLFGGTTAYSAGVIWIPGSRQAVAAGLIEPPGAALAYLRSEAGNHFDAARAEAFLAAAPEALAFLEANTHVRYQLHETWSDYHPLAPGGSAGGRSLLPEPFDGRRLGDLFPRLRPPLPTTMLFGGMMVGRADLPHLFAMTRSMTSAWHVAKMLARYGHDRLAHPRGTRLTNGNALMARLALSARERGIPLHLSTPILRLTRKDGRVAGALVGGPADEREVVASRGVVLATGGFPQAAEMTAQTHPHRRDGKAHFPLAPAGNVGDGARIAGEAGGAFNGDVRHAAAWAPVSRVPDGREGFALYPHFIDRGKPGIIAVDRRGRRFANEARSYHDFVPAMIEACRDDAQVEAFLIADHRAIRRFGLGRVPPAPGRLGPWLASGYLTRAGTPRELAAALGIDADGLAATLADFNRHARDGKDPAFGRGSDSYQHFNGAPGHGPNPNLVPLETAPFYAVRIHPGDLGTFAGLRTDGSARVLNAAGAAIPGLFAVGNDAASVMGGAYPGAGITIGPALTFGYLAGMAIARD